MMTDEERAEYWQLRTTVAQDALTIERMRQQQRLLMDTVSRLMRAIVVLADIADRRRGR